jgi:shikimate dehydrogenase
MMSETLISECSVCLVIGDPVSHSLSPLMHNAAYKITQSKFIMRAERVSSENLSTTLKRFRDLGVRGLAVTMPHKTAIMDLLDRIDPVAQRIGAVNTVVNDSGILTGYNTDWLGILRPLEAETQLEGRSVALLGAGGAAQAAAYACASGGASVTIFNRSLARAQSLANTFGCKARTIESAGDLRSFDIIINTTPVGMAPDTRRSPLASSALRSHHTVFETIYSPSVTELLKQSREVGARTISGLQMFLEQGVAQFSLHTGFTPPRDEMARVLKEASDE